MSSDRFFHVNIRSTGRARVAEAAWFSAPVFILDEELHAFLIDLHHDYFCSAPDARRQCGQQQASVLDRCEPLAALGDVSSMGLCRARLCRAHAGGAVSAGDDLVGAWAFDRGACGRRTILDSRANRERDGFFMQCIGCGSWVSAGDCSAAAGLSATALSRRREL